MADTKELDLLLADTDAPRLARSTRFKPVNGSWGDLSDDDEDDEEEDPVYLPSNDPDADPSHHTLVVRRRILPIAVEIPATNAAESPGDRKKKTKSNKRRRAEALDDEQTQLSDTMQIESPGKPAHSPLEGDASPQTPRAKKKKRKTSHTQAALDSPSPNKQTTPVQATASPEVNGTASQGLNQKKRKRPHIPASPSKGSRSMESPKKLLRVVANGNGPKATSSDSDDEEEIDDLFDDLVKQRAANKATQLAQRQKEQQAKPSPKKNGKTKKHQGLPARYTDDGLRILSYDDIAADQPKGLNGACPFECSCCY
ncbi:unnamed protein product [Chondrus crispus]|uniref:DUF1764 domain-containing protein n=1 Tax=Chondrus crispus TaxID=2769 RepID=R7QJV1_CHOCR|nr:unnamed protein product [Chondrus crispus]CDF37756.1 unnamed protein product [Chondrus crispus]|eukprot:XP_005717627.1 unnamed protein product [Chondrus crispus]